MRLLREHYRAKQNSEYGFTLIEILVVIVILGILAAVAIPLYSNYRQRANDAVVVAEVDNVLIQLGTLETEARLKENTTNRGKLSDEWMLFSVETKTQNGERSVVIYENWYKDGEDEPVISSKNEGVRVAINKDVTIYSEELDPDSGVTFEVCGYHPNSKTYPTKQEAKCAWHYGS